MNQVVIKTRVRKVINYSMTKAHEMVEPKPKIMSDNIISGLLNKLKKHKLYTFESYVWYKLSQTLY